MKRIVRIGSFLLVLALLFVGVAVAAGDNDPTIKVVEGIGATATFNEDFEFVNVTVSAANLTAGEEYVVLMLKIADAEDGVNAEYTIDEKSIMYIDQTTAVADGTNGKVEFKVYPQAIKDSIILITGVGGEALKVAIVDGKYVIGDVDGVDDVTGDDLILLARYLVGDVAESEIVPEAADLDGLDGITGDDLILLARVLVGDISIDDL